jgi:hypothetical protein
MKALFNKLRAALSSARIHECGIIPIDEEGWWKHRRSPAASLREVARLFNELGGRTIMEIGSGLHGELAGNSIFTWVRRTAARRIVAVDADEGRVEEVKRATAGDPRVEALVADGVQYLEQFRGTIDLLYLDYWVPDPEGAVHGVGRAEGYRDAYRAARDKMNGHSLLLIDDTDHVHPWKHTHIVPDARTDGFRVVYEGRQTLLRR